MAFVINVINHDRNQQLLSRFGADISGVKNMDSFIRVGLFSEGEISINSSSNVGGAYVVTGTRLEQLLAVPPQVRETLFNSFKSKDLM